MPPAKRRRSHGFQDVLLRVAVGSNDVGGAAFWITAGASVRQQVPEGSLLSLAAYKENPEMVRLLLDAGVPVSNHLFHVVEPIETAIRASDSRAAAEMAIDLLYAGATVTTDDLYYVARRGNAVAMWYMAQLGVSFDGVLAAAIASGCMVTTALAVAAGATLNAAEERVFRFAPWHFDPGDAAMRRLLGQPNRAKAHWTPWAHFCWPPADKLAVETFYFVCNRLRTQNGNQHLPCELMQRVCSFFVLAGESRLLLDGG